MNLYSGRGFLMLGREPIAKVFADRINLSVLKMNGGFLTEERTYGGCIDHQN